MLLSVVKYVICPHWSHHTLAQHMDSALPLQCTLRKRRTLCTARMTHHRPETISRNSKIRKRAFHVGVVRGAKRTLSFFLRVCVWRGVEPKVSVTLRRPACAAAMALALMGDDSYAAEIVAKLESVVSEAKVRDHV